MRVQANYSQHQIKPPCQWNGLTLSRIASSNGVMVAILVETENKRREARPGRTRGIIEEVEK